MSTAVYYFGGFQATQPQVDSWVRSAHQKKPSVGFNGYAYPDGVNYDYKSAINGSKKLRESAVATIGACRADIIYIVGHSSGCAISNAVDSALKNTSNVRLVALDGFAPDKDQRERPYTQVWSAVNGKHISLNYKDLKDLLKDDLNEYQAKTDCTTKVALHFSLVNAAANDSRVKNIATGYTDCEANLMWLK